MRWFIESLKKYAVFEGRSHRTEYWMFTLVVFIISILLGLIEAISGMNFIGTLFSLAIFIPGIAVTIRRLHDIGRSGWWIFIGLIPIIGFIVLLVWAVRKSDEGVNRFGEPQSY